MTYLLKKSQFPYLTEEHSIYVNTAAVSLCSEKAGRSGDEIPVVAGFSAPVQLGPGAQPAFYIVCTVFSPETKWPGLGLDNRNASRAEVIERVELHLYSNSGPLWPVIG